MLRSIRTSERPLLQDRSTEGSRSTERPLSRSGRRRSSHVIPEGRPHSREHVSASRPSTSVQQAVPPNDDMDPSQDQIQALVQELETERESTRSDSSLRTEQEEIRGTRARLSPGGLWRPPFLQPILADEDRSSAPPRPTRRPLSRAGRRPLLDQGWGGRLGMNNVSPTQFRNILNQLQLAPGYTGPAPGGIEFIETINHHYYIWDGSNYLRSHDAESHFRAFRSLQTLQTTLEYFAQITLTALGFAVGASAAVAVGRSLGVALGLEIGEEVTGQLVNSSIILPLIEANIDDPVTATVLSILTGVVIGAGISSSGRRLTQSGAEVIPQSRRGQYQRIPIGAARDHPNPPYHYFDELSHDEPGRVRALTGRLRREHLRTGTGTTSAARAAAGDLDAGHLRARLLGGTGGIDNTFPQAPARNRGLFRVFEGRLARLVGNLRDEEEIICNKRDLV